MATRDVSFKIPQTFVLAKDHPRSSLFNLRLTYAYIALFCQIVEKGLLKLGGFPWHS